jgi:hypothetical protein
MNIVEDPQTTTTTENDLPDLLADLAAEIGSQKNFSARVMRKNPTSGHWELLVSMTRLPDPDEVGKLYGGGWYRLVVTWRIQGVTTGRPLKREIEFCLSDAYNSPETAARLRGTSAAPAAPVTDADTILAAAERLAKIRPSEDAGAGMGALLERLFDRLDRMQERQDSKFEKLLEVIAQKPAPDPLATWRESMAMAKEMGLPVIGHEKDERAPWIEVAELVADNLGRFLELMTEAQKSNVAKIKAMANPQVRRVVTVGREAVKDPKKRHEMISAMDAKVGREATNTILEGLGIKRETNE